MITEEVEVIFKILSQQRVTHLKRTTKQDVMTKGADNDDETLDQYDRSACACDEGGTCLQTEALKGHEEKKRLLPGNKASSVETSHCTTRCKLNRA